MTDFDVAARANRPPSAEDCELIGNLTQAYCIFSDEGRREDMSQLFCADASWDGDDLGYGRASGPEAIAEIVLSHFDPLRPMFHFGGPPLLESVSDDEVRSYMWCIAGREEGGPTIYFEYRDVLRRDPVRGWLFAHRLLRKRRRS